MPNHPNPGLKTSAPFNPTFATIDLEIRLPMVPAKIMPNFSRSSFDHSLFSFFTYKRNCFTSVYIIVWIFSRKALRISFELKFNIDLMNLSRLNFNPLLPSSLMKLVILLLIPSKSSGCLILKLLGSSMLSKKLLIESMAFFFAFWA